MDKTMIPAGLMAGLKRGMAIPAIPLALDSGRRFDERRQRALVRYYIDAGAGGTKLYILDKGLIRLSHIINHGGQDITLSLSRALGISVEEAEKMKRREGLATEGGESHVPLTAVLNVIFSEASRTIQNFEHKSGRKVKDIILSGGGANLKGIFEVAQQHFLVPVERANPFQQVEVPAFLEDMLKEAGPEFTVALGIAFRELQDGG